MAVVSEAVDHAKDVEAVPAEMAATLAIPRMTSRLFPCRDTIGPAAPIRLQPQPYNKA